MKFELVQNLIVNVKYFYRNQFGRTVVANYVAAVTGILAPLIALPWYLSTLGSVQWGLVSFIAVLQAMLSLLDAGLSQALVKKFSEYRTEIKKNKKFLNLFFSMERLSWIFSGALAVIVIVFSSAISELWLQTHDEIVPNGQLTIIGAALIFFWVNGGSIYRSVLIASDSQIALSVLSSISIIVRHAATVVVLQFHPFLIAYIATQILFLAVEVMVRKFISFICIGKDKGQWDFELIKELGTYFAGMIGATLVGVLTVQLDKLMVSKFLSVEKLGYYSIASVIGLGVLQLVYPMMYANLPKLSVCKKKSKVRSLINLKTFVFFIVVIFFSWFLYIKFGKHILIFWIGNIGTVDIIYPVVTVLLIGSTINAFWCIGQINLIADGDYPQIARINFLILGVVCVVMPITINSFGMIGAAYSWVLLNLIGFFITCSWVVNLIEIFFLKFYKNSFLTRN